MKKESWFMIPTNMEYISFGETFNDEIYFFALNVYKNPFTWGILITDADSNCYSNNSDFGYACCVNFDFEDVHFTVIVNPEHDGLYEVNVVEN